METKQQKEENTPDSGWMEAGLKCYHCGSYATVYNRIQSACEDCQHTLETDLPPFVIQACNLHGELVGVCADLVKWLENILAEGSIDMAYLLAFQPRLLTLRRAGAILRKAENAKRGKGE